MTSFGMSDNTKACIHFFFCAQHKTQLRHSLSLKEFLKAISRLSYARVYG